jgi:hypothetical protein
VEWNEIKEAIKEDKIIYFGNTLLKKLFYKITQKDFYLTGKYIIYARKAGYYKENRNKFINKILCVFYMRKKNRLGIKLHIDIAPSFFGRRIIIWHGNFIANYHSRIGNDCQFHGNNCLGSIDKLGEQAPILENNIDVGVGANIIGKVRLASGIKVGANALVNKSFLKENSTIIGVPAHEK